MFKELNDFYFKSTEKLAEMNVCNTNTNFNAEDIISDHEFLLPILNASTVGTEEYYPRC